MAAEVQSETKSFDVLIVGCGPVGATLANCLRVFGHKVAIFDRDKEVFYAPRAMGFDDESLRLYQAIGLLDRIEQGGNSYHFDAWNYDVEGRHLYTLGRERLGDLMTESCGHYAMTIADQPTIERMLRDDFELEPRVDAYLGYEVLEVRSAEDCASLTARKLANDEQLEFEAKYIVGCDGGRSLVRAALSVDRIDLGYSEEYLVVDAIVDDEAYFRGAIKDGARFTIDPKFSGVVVKGLHGHVRFDVLRHPDVMQVAYEKEEDYEEAAKALIKRSGFDVDKFRVIRHAPYTFYAGMPSHWRKDRLFVMGDAAHQTPPWAGQGLNMGIRDAGNLSFKLDMVLKGRAPQTLLDTYEAERKPVCQHTIGGAVATGKNMQTSDPKKIRKRNFMFFLARNSRYFNRLMWKKAVRKPPYEVGLLGKTHPLSGTVMIQPEVQDMAKRPYLLDDLIGLNFALITIDSSTGDMAYRFASELDGVVLKPGRDFIDPGGALSTWFKTNRVSAVLIRPDRYIFDAGQNGNRLCESLLDQIRATK